MLSLLPSLLSSWWAPMPKPATPSPNIFSLPVELLTEIALHSREWSKFPTAEHDDQLAESDQSLRPSRDSKVSLPSNLAALSTTCRLLNDVATPVMFRDVQVSSAQRLRSLASLSASKLALIRTLNLHLDYDFFAELARELDPDFRFNPNVNPEAALPPSNGPSLITALCTVMVGARDLESFSMGLAKAAARSSAWRHFAYRSRGIAFGPKFEETLKTICARPDAVRWPRLTHIHLDGLQNLTPLLKRTPSLTHLSVRLVEGFDMDSRLELLNDILNSLVNVFETPRCGLKSLAISTRTMEFKDSGLDYLQVIGAMCPVLERLDLRVNGFHPGRLPYVSVCSQPGYETTVLALSHFKHLRTLHLPGNLFTAEESQLFEPVAPTAQQVAERQRALKAIAGREREAASVMAEAAPRLEHVSWVRPTETIREDHRSVVYRVGETKSAEFIHSQSETRLHQVPKNICSPLVGPSLLGYPRSLEGTVALIQEHLMLTAFICAVLVVGLYLLLLLFIPTRMMLWAFPLALPVTGVCIVRRRVLSSSLAMLVLINGFPSKVTKKLAKEMSKRAPVPIF